MKQKTMQTAEMATVTGWAVLIFSPAKETR
jgi:hypothetical protein